MKANAPCFQRAGGKSTKNGRWRLKIRLDVQTSTGQASGVARRSAGKKSSAFPRIACCLLFRVPFCRGLVSSGPFFLLFLHPHPRFPPRQRGIFLARLARAVKLPAALLASPD